MKLRLYIGGLIAFSVLFSSCGKDSEEGESFEPHTYNVSGKVEKGPFVSGSTITIQPMDSKLQVRGDFYSSTIQDDMGNFFYGTHALPISICVPVIRSNSRLYLVIRFSSNTFSSIPTLSGL